MEIKTFSMGNNMNMNSSPGSNVVNQENPNGNEVSNNSNSDNVVVLSGSVGGPGQNFTVSTVVEGIVSASIPSSIFFIHVASRYVEDQPRAVRWICSKKRTPPVQVRGAHLDDMDAHSIRCHSSVITESTSHSSRCHCNWGTFVH